MALEYFLYRTDYNNTLVDRGATSFAPLPPNTEEILIDFFIPQNQPLYFYKEQGGNIVLNDEQTIESYLNATILETPDSYVTFRQLTGYTATTGGISESIFSEYTATTQSTINGKLNSSLFNTYTGTTAPNEYVSKANFNAHTGTTINTANNGLTKVGTNVILGGTLTGATTINSPDTGSRLSFSGFPIQYSSDLSANYNNRSLVDRGYVLGAKTYTGGTQTFISSGLELKNPSSTFQYIFAGSEIVADRIVRLPLLTDDDTFVMRSFPEVLTNKTITGTTNNVAANSLKTAGSNYVNVSSSASPAQGQLLIATSATNAAWGNLTNYSVGSTTPINTTSTSYTAGVNAGLSLTPEAGTYFVTYSVNTQHSNNFSNFAAIHVGGTIVSETEREYRRSSNNMSNYTSCLSASAIVTVNGSQSIEVRFRVNSGTATILKRNLVIFRIGS